MSSLLDVQAEQQDPWVRVWWHHRTLHTVEHYRTGSSIARAAYAGILPAYQPKLRQAQTLKIQEESQTLSTFVQKRETPPEYADVQWLARPTHPSFHYCGLDEFEGRYYKCEVKNAEQSCPDFVRTVGRGHVASLQFLPPQPAAARPSRAGSRGDVPALRPGLPAEP